MSLAGPGAGEKRNAAWAVTRPTGGAGLPGPIFASGGLLGGFPSAAFATPSRGLPARIEALLSFVRQFSCSQSLLALLQRSSASPRHILDTGVASPT
jgi:hypothetical protein